MEKNLGHATAYGYAKSKGYTGTEEEFGVLMASYASVAQDASQSASSAAESAQLASDEAQRASQSATNAHNDAETASNIKTDVESARDTTVNAKNATVEAKDISVEAKNSAISAKDTAESKAQIAEAWAVGQKDGTDVPSTDGTYHNNAKYYSEQADIAKTNAESAQQLAQTSATSASESSSNAAASAQTANQAAQTATDKASEASQSASTATNKASEASQSATSASQSAATATNKSSEATTAATTATTKASEAVASATTAITAKTDAETAKDAAAQSASEAAASAIEAAQSAQSVDAERLNRIAFGSYVVEESAGAIASFTDGADNIPMKNVLVHIEPVQEGSGDPSPDNVRPITGWTACEMTRCGKNLLNASDYENVTRNTLNAELSQKIQDVIAKGANVFTISGNTAAVQVDGNSISFIIEYADGILDTTVIYRGSENSSGALTGDWNVSTNPQKSIKYVRFGGNTGSAQCTLTNLQIELGSTATDYEPYHADTYDITFPTEAGTVYGGTLDVTSGELVVDRAMVDLASLTWELRSSGLYRSTEIPDIKTVDKQNVRVNGIAEKYIVDSYTRAKDNLSAFYLGMDSNNKRVFVSGGSSGSGSFVYELATPITYTLTPQEITSLLGANNLWADTGDSEISYCVDPTLLLDNESSEIQSIKSMIAGVESSAVATKNYSIGDLVIVEDTLYEVTAAIASGETISVSNTRVTTVDDVIRNRIAAVDNVIENKIADSIDDTLTQSGQAADAKVTGNEIDSLKSDLNGLTGKKENHTTNWEIGNISVNATSGYTYNSSGRRLRTKEGISCHLKKGNTVTIKNEVELTKTDQTKETVQLQFWVSWYNATTGKYEWRNYDSSEFTAPIESDYVFVIHVTGEPNYLTIYTDAISVMSSALSIFGDSITLKMEHDFEMSNFDSDGATKFVCRMGWNVYNSTTPPQGSVTSFKEAYKHGFRIMLADIFATADNKLVIAHDDNISLIGAKNSDGTAISGTVNITESTLSQLDAYDFGIYKGSEYAGYKIPRLEAFLRFCKKYNCKIIFEMKDRSLSDEELQSFVSMINKYGLMDSIISVGYIRATDSEKFGLLFPNTPLWYDIGTLTEANINYVYNNRPSTGNYQWIYMLVNNTHPVSDAITQLTEFGEYVKSKGMGLGITELSATSELTALETGGVLSMLDYIAIKDLSTYVSFLYD